MHTHQELITLATDGSLILALAFSPDGNKIVVLNMDPNNDLNLLIWRAPSWAQIEAVEKGQTKQ